MTEKGIIPFCHGEPMLPTYRYKTGGIIFRTFVCQFCRRKEEVEWS